jgi:hypothetical protein
MGIHWPTSDVDGTQQSTAEERLRALVDVLVAGGGNALAVEDIDTARWRKNLWFAYRKTLHRTTVFLTALLSRMLGTSGTPSFAP